MSMPEPTVTPTTAEPHSALYSYDAAVNGDYPAVIHEPGEGCQPCDVSAASYGQCDRDTHAAWRQHERQAREPEAGL